ncbi:hypothetical protein Cus16_2478 [Curtobacterium sp. ER1/6]|nr:hypothetical protein Cus16_2478 [Curtobacterium sp. ER1/6]
MEELGLSGQDAVAQRGRLHRRRLAVQLVSGDRALVARTVDPPDLPSDTSWSAVPLQP